jgi:acyl carrier protein
MSPSEIKSRLTTVFRSTFNDDAIEISEATTAVDIPQWDSLTHINLVLATEKAFAVRFTTREVRSLKTVGDLTKMIEQKII